jgi:ferritin-like protein
VQPWGNLERRDHLAIFGVPGSGKSTLARKIAAPARRVVFFDPGADHEDEGIVVSAADLAAYPDLLRGTWVRVVVAAGRDGADAAEEVETVIAACAAAEDEGGILLVCDEVGDYGSRAAHDLTSLHRSGHKRGIASILVSQRAVDVPLGARATANRVYSLLQDHPHDLAALAEVYGEDYAAHVAAWKPGDPPVEWSRRSLSFPAPAKGRDPVEARST